MSKLNSKTLTVAAILLVVLALLMLATPLLGPALGLTGRTGTVRQFQGNGSTPNFQGFQNGQGNNSQGQGNSAQGQTTPDLSNRQFQGRTGSSIFRLGFLNGVTGTIVYAVALLVSLGAAAGMFITKAWGKILGIIIAVLYAAIALISIVPSLLLSATFRLFNPLSIGLNVVHLVLAIAVIILALIPAKKLAAAPITTTTPPASPA
jgi:hypothetical protein